MPDDDYVLIIRLLSCLPPPPHSQWSVFRLLIQDADIMKDNIPWMRHRVEGLRYVDVECRCFKTCVMKELNDERLTRNIFAK